MNSSSRLALGVVMMTAAADAMAHSGPHQATWLVVAGAGVIGFLAGVLWCRRGDKNKDKDNQSSDR
jgi:threonine dehydrogenase-like Zn-dependent dehydrogenase